MLRGEDAVKEQENTVLKLFPNKVKKILQQAGLHMEDLQEIRLRAGQPLICFYRGQEVFLTEWGTVSENGKDGFLITKEMLQETMAFVSHYSIYAFDEEVKQGYITVAGGHRVGIAGKMIMEDGKVKGIRYISFLNVRFSHEKKGCADTIMPYLVKNGQFCHTLIISPPKCGKTTLLRDIIRQVSNGNQWLAGQNVAVVDERSEIGGCYQGVPQNDLGIRTDVLDGCPKAEGMMMLIRSMAPDIVAVDEIGDVRDSQALETVFHCGCKLLATVHGNSVEEIRQKPLLQRLVKYHYFQRYVVLDREKNVGHIRDIFDERGTRLNEYCERDWHPVDPVVLQQDGKCVSE